MYQLKEDSFQVDNNHNMKQNRKQRFGEINLSFLDKVEQQVFYYEKLLK